MYEAAYAKSICSNGRELAGYWDAQTIVTRRVFPAGLLIGLSVRGAAYKPLAISTVLVFDKGVLVTSFKRIEQGPNQRNFRRPTRKWTRTESGTARNRARWMAHALPNRKSRT